MTFAQIGEWLYGYEDGEQVASVQVVERDGIVTIGNLEAKGHFREVVDKLREMSKGKTARLCVDYGENMEPLVHLYSRIGFVPKGIIMEMEVG